VALPRLFVRSISLIALLAVAALFAQLGHAAPRASAGPNCDATGSIDSEELELLRLINDYRAQNGHQPLIFSSSLSRSAAWKAQDIADRNYFAPNDTPIGREWAARIRDCGYTFNTFLGENIAGGDWTAAGTLGIWQHSTSHNGLLLDDTFRAIGIGRAHNASGYWYWVMDVGGTVDARIAGGDVDCNGRVDTVDASLILQRAAALVSTLDCDTEADADSSGTVDATDALLVLQYAAGLVG
jgi:uncharacterized protein YkwD